MITRVSNVYGARSLVATAVFYLLLATTPTPVRADLVVIDFEQFSASNTEVYSKLDFVQNGVTFSIYRPDNVTFRLTKVGYIPFGEVSLSPFNGTGGAGINSPFVLEVSAPVRSITVSMGDWGEDADTLKLVGFEGPGLTGRFASSEGSLPTGPNNIFTVADVHLRAPSDIGYFRSFTLQGGGASFPNSVFYDNITLITASAVPEPSSFLLLSIAGLGYFIRRRRRSPSI